MDEFDVFQKNNLRTGVNLAAELPSSSPEKRAFVVVGAYILTAQGLKRPPKTLNVDLPTLRFWIRKYEVKKFDLDNGFDITDHDLIDSIYLNDIKTIEELEVELGKYLQNISLMEVSWKVDSPFP